MDPIYEILIGRIEFHSIQTKKKTMGPEKSFEIFTKRIIFAYMGGY